MKKIALFGLLTVAALGIGFASLSSKPAIADENYDVKVFLGKKVDPFSLPDPSGKSVKVGDWNTSKASVIMFIATRCPVSLDYDARMKKLADTYTSKGVRFFGINSNKQEPTDEMASHAKEKGLTFPILKDAGNKIADNFDAHVTPEVYVVNSNGILVYKGNIDNSRDQSKVNQKSLEKALDAVLAGKTVDPKETRAFGCSIKRVN
jgi:peroxiredoxin